MKSAPRSRIRRTFVRISWGPEDTPTRSSGGISASAGSPVMSPPPPGHVTYAPAHIIRGPMSRPASIASRSARSVKAWNVPMSRTVVNPASTVSLAFVTPVSAPWAEVLSTRNAYPCPESNSPIRCAWQSIRPGSTVRPERSIVSGDDGASEIGTTSSIRPSTTTSARSATASLPTGSIRRPARTTTVPEAIAAEHNEALRSSRRPQVLAGGSAASTELLVDQRNELRSTERPGVTGAHQLDGERAQALERANEGGLVFGGERIVEGGGVAGEEEAGRRIPERDRARGVAGHVEHLEGPVAEVHHVSVLHEARRLGGRRPPATEVETDVRHRGHDHVRRLVPNPPIPLPEPLGEVRPQGREFERAPDAVGIVRVAPALVEGMQPADVIEVLVCGDGDRRPILHQRRELPAKVPDPVARVDDQIAVASPHVPDVGLEERVEVSLHEERDPRRGRLRAEPAIGDGEGHQTRSVNETAAGDGRKQCADTIE